MSGKNRTTWTPEQYREYMKKKAEQFVDGPQNIELLHRKAEQFVAPLVLGPRIPENPFLFSFTVPGEPVPKPRMSQRDKWKKRPCVLRYRAWADHARACAPKQLPDNPLSVSVTAYLPIPESWSKKKKAEHQGKPHRQKPDLDNILKALDALFTQDMGIAELHGRKFWDDGNGPRLEIEVQR